MNITTNKAAIIVGVIIVLILSLWMFLNIFPMMGGLFGPKSTVTIDGKTFKVAIADTDAKREKGLSGRNSLPKDQGMLFLFDQPDYYSFWMKEMKFPLDLIYINNDKVVSIYVNVQPPTDKNSPLPLYKPSIPADKVLEVNAGIVQENGIKTGDTVTTSL